MERLGGLDRRSVGERVRVEDVHLAVAQALEERGGECLLLLARTGDGISKVAQLVVVDDPALSRAVGEEQQVWWRETAAGGG